MFHNNNQRKYEIHLPSDLIWVAKMPVSEKLILIWQFSNKLFLNSMLDFTTNIKRGPF